MISREQMDRFIDHPVVEWTIFGVGVILILLSPLAGAIPGPGGIFIFAMSAGTRPRLRCSSDMGS